jgi:hypothetical protein
MISLAAKCDASVVKRKAPPPQLRQSAACEPKVISSRENPRHRPAEVVSNPNGHSKRCCIDGEDPPTCAGVV